MKNKWIAGTGILVLYIFMCIYAGHPVSAVYYNDTNATEGNNVLDMVQGVNQESNGLFGIVLLATVFFMLLIVFKRNEMDIRDVFVVDGFISTIIAILMWGLQLLAWYSVIYPLLILLGGILAYKFQNTLS